MLVEFTQALLFYAAFSVFAAIGWPLMGRIIGHKMLAYTCSKPIGLLLFGYFIWLACRLQILDYQNLSIIVVLLVLTIVACSLLHWIKKATALSLLPKDIILTEAITLAVYLAFLWVRSHNSSGGSEKFMDIAMFSAAGKTHFFPFIDPWYAGKTVNYYYYGHYLMSLLSNLSNTPYIVSYNFALGFIYAMTIMLSATWVHSNTGSKKCGVLAAFLVTTASTIYFAERTGFEWIKGKTLPLFTSTHFYDPSYTIREIPSYSFTVGDLHAHLIALPFFLTNLILLHSLLTHQRPRGIVVALLMTTFAASAMISSWDLITLTGLLGMGMLFKPVINLRNIKQLATRATAEWCITFFVILGGAYLIALPYLYDFKMPVMGIGFIPTYIQDNHLENVQYPTTLLALLGMWGLFLLSFLLYLPTKQKDKFQLAIGVVVVVLIIGMELFFVKDIYSIANPPYFRGNTTFKFGFHAWVLSALVFSLWIGKLIQLPRTAYYAWFLAILALVAGGFYPYQAARQYFILQDHTLNITKWIKTFDPGDYATINYINENIHERSVIAEAIKDSYTNYSRISSYTGMITPMGWPSHEWGWRFHAPSPGLKSGDTGWPTIADVAGDIRVLYSIDDMEKILSIVKQYHIEYIYIGKLERTEYPLLKQEKFSKIGSLVFTSDGNSLYKITNP